MFTVVGSNPPPAIRELEKSGITIAGYLTDPELEDAYRQARVVVAPLLAGGGIKGKVAEAIRWGVPVVTTDIGAQGFEDLEGALARTDDPAQMASSIGVLLQDDTLWQQKSAASLRLARKMFSEDAMWRVLSDLLSAEKARQQSIRAPKETALVS
jgi:glycosyltransferase involved in cell wall biosynthesis